jgi:hypothetical protein
MNQYTQLLYYIKRLAESDDFVNTVSKGDFTKLDLKKASIFPLLHINITGAGFPSDGTINFNVQIGAFDIRDKNKEIKTDNFWENDNEVDNHNETLSVINRIWLIMLKDFEKNNITASETPSLEIVTEDYSNLIDGWIITFDVTMPNIEINLCETI